jgi:polar amino acid transport system substrate-binding protein
MNRKRFLIPLIFSVVLFLIWTASLASAGALEDIKSKGVLVVSSDANYAPQSFLNDKGELDGFDIAVSKEVAKRLGVKVKFVTPDWDLIVAGKWGARWDLSIGSMTITDARSKVVDFSTAYYYTPAQFGVHKKNTTIKKLDDFSGKTVGLGSGTTYETYLDPNQTLGIVRVDGVLTSGFVIQEASKKGIPIKSVGAPVYYEPLAAASDKARPGSADLIKKVSEIFQAMHKDGTLTKLSMKWFGFEVTKKAE